MGDRCLGVLLTVLLLGANAFFVGSEFALISARRDRLEALAEQGKNSAVTVIRAGENLSLMLAGAQLGITICSILLGRVGEPAVAHLLEKPFDLVGIPDAVLHTVSFVVALTIVVVLHVLLGEMVPKNIAIAGPESTAMLLIPAYLIWMRVARPFIAFYNWCANITLRALRVRAQGRTRHHGVHRRAVRDDRRVAARRGCSTPRSTLRLTRALQIRNRVVADVAVPLGEIRAVPVAAAGSGPTVDGDRARAGRDRLLAGSRHRPVRPLHRLPAHQGRAAARSTTPTPSSTARRCARCRGCATTLPLPDALSRLRRSNSHLALVTDARRRRDRDGGARGSGRRPGRHRARRHPPCLTRHRSGPFHPCRGCV